MSTRTYVSALFLRLAAIVAPVLALTAFAQAQEPEFVPVRLLVKFREGVNDVAAVHTIHAHGAFWASTIDGIGVKMLSLPDIADPRAEAAAFRQEGNVEFAEPDYIDGSRNRAVYRSFGHLLMLPGLLASRHGTSPTVGEIRDSRGTACGRREGLWN
ncbi:MAG: hypothetical protein HYR64_05175 [Fimbriimonas ginsengisoli]|uniref:Fervidolysin-like N-terminal prodomain domain-containing protein n=1 Tax=Fimbriimonas ginsengisoli TaxID=1005039 RepID=A0A931PVP3_FIMGI|nr:hypothetical protein [Fimbriimonas ginsengisoli]